MEPEKKRVGLFHKLSTRIFLMILVGIILPVSLLLVYTGGSYKQYIQNELSDRTISQLNKGESEIYLLFQRLVNIASVVCNADGLQAGLEDPQSSRYENTLAFDEVVSTIVVNNLFDMTDVKITLFDRSGNVYANWGTNYNNYNFLYEQDWVQDSIAARGHVRWNLFAPSYILEDGGKTNYISVAKSLLSSQTGETLATVIVSLEQGQLCQALRQFFCEPDDMIYICTEGGNVVLRLDEKEALHENELAELLQQGAGQDSGNRVISLDTGSYLVSYYTLSRQFTFNGDVLKVFHFTNYDDITRDIDQFTTRLTLSMGLCVGVLIVICYLTARTLVKPIELLSDKMLHYELEGDITGLDFQRGDEVGQLNRAFRQMSEAIRRLFERQREESAERERYRFEALRAQVNPHFLFNTLNTIRWMAIIRKADNIADCIDALATMMKYSMSRGGEMVSVKEELESIDSYIYIHNCRYGDRVSIEYDIPEEVKRLRVIKFILQPIVENAIIHGFKELDYPGRIMIYGDVEDGCLHLFVEDNGVGIRPETAMELNGHRNEKKVTGIGVANVNERIRSAYGEGYGIRLIAGEPSGTVVEYTLPVVEGEDDAEDTDRG